MGRLISVSLALGALVSSASAQTLPRLPIPPGNEPTLAKEMLGQALFWDEQLSSDGTIACGTCHFPEAGGGDPRAWLDADRARHPGLDLLPGTEDDRFGSPGVRRRGREGELLADRIFDTEVQVTDRRPRTNIGAAFMTRLFWDGRATDTLYDPDTGEEVLPWAAGLEVQSLAPILNDVEMAHEGRHWGDVALTLLRAKPLALSPSIPADLHDWIDGRDYPELFEEAFGVSDLSAVQIAMALATYQRTLIPDQAPILAVDAQLTDTELRGLRNFRRFGCAECHDHRQGLFTDQTFHFIGVAPVEADGGLARATGDPDDAGLFLTPSLLNVGLRGPYFHDGSKATLEDVLEFYERGGDHGTRFQREIAPLRITAQEKRDLAAFLRRPLTDPRVQSATGPFERPLLSWEAEERYVAPVLGISGPGGRALDTTPVLVEARTTLPFTAFLPAHTSYATIADRTVRALVKLRTDDVAALRFVLPQVVPDDPALLGDPLRADMLTLEADVRLRGTLVIEVESALEAPGTDS